MLNTLITELLAIAAIAAIASFASHYYGLIQSKADVEKAWAKLAVALTRRRAALDELLDAAKGDERFRPGVLTDARRLLSSTGTPESGAQRFAAEVKLSSAIGKVLASSQNYPNLAHDLHYRKLEETLLDLEEEIARRRDIYNAQVAANNAHFNNIFERSIAQFADAFPWDPFPESPGEATSGATISAKTRTVPIALAG